jgi:AcrR family transcriptional regulator
VAHVVVTREDYFAAALDGLASEGHSAVRIAPLCRRLGVTTGSFYHYFGGFDRFVVELLEHWEDATTRSTFARTLTEPDPLKRLRMVKRSALDLPHEAETAIRAWSHVNPLVEAAQARVDGARLEHVRTVVAAFVPDRRRARLLAVHGLSLLVGVQQWRTPVDRRELGRLLDGFEAMVLADAG